MRLSKNISITIVCILLGIILAWQYKSINYNQNLVAFENKRLEDLKDELLKEKKKYDDLSQRNRELESQVSEYENARGSIDETTKSLQKELERVRLVAGLMDVKGKGVIITMDNNEKEYGYIEESHILEVLNELRASEAQAISVNDERIVAMSEVREVANGKYIVINNKKMQAPFVIKASGDPDKLEHSLKMIGGVVESLEGIYHLKIDVKKSDDIMIAKVRDDGSVIKTDLLNPVKAAN